MQAAITATSAEPPSASASAAASWEAPANTIVDRPMAAAPPSPLVAGVAPATSPNGITPTSMGATALAPARSSARAVGVGTGASCRGPRAVATGITAPYAGPRAPRSPPPSTLAPAKPVLRGWMHLVCFFLAIPAGVTVVALAQSPRGRVGALWCTPWAWWPCSV